jgi:glycosyltransferase involved in cell wall biosynthesis
LFQPSPQPRPVDGVFRCVYYGTFIRNHGLEYVIEAARILQSDPTVQFELIGQGPERERIMALAESYGLQNVRFIEWMDVEDLVQHVADSDLNLGSFGSTPQALMTMQNKVHESLAMGKAMVNGDSPVMRALLEHGKQIYLCERENGESLAEAIRAVRSDPELRRRLEQGGYEYYQRYLSMQCLGEQLKGYLEEFLG